MSLTDALSSALSGLNASSRAADVVAGNLANALTEGHAPRGLEQAAQRDGGGVRLLGVTRQVDAGLLADRRLADSALAGARTRSDAIARIETALGTPGEAGALSTRITDFEVAVTEAANRPDSAARQQAVLHAAIGLAGTFGQISQSIGRHRNEAEGEIALGVRTLNEGLLQAQTLNEEIVKARATGRASAGLEDRRQALIDRLADHVPLRQIRRDSGAVALISTGGAMLLDARAARIGFSPVNMVDPQMTRAGGALSGLTINGIALRDSTDDGPMGGGRLGALFEFRDGTATDLQSRIDALAQDLLTRVQAPGLNPGRSAAEPALFTDAGSPFDGSDTVGLAGRIAVNPAVDPNRGGALFRLRDGLGATTPGAAGDGALLARLAEALAAPASLSPDGPERALRGHAADLTSHVGQSRLALEHGLGHAEARQAELGRQTAAAGVDSDAELQRLMLIEQAYGANARLLRTVDEMLQTLLRI